MAVLGLAAGAQAGRTRIVAADQAAAQRAVVRVSDLPTNLSWKREKTTPGGGGAGSACPGYAPSTRDLVTTGQASSKFSASGITITSDADLLASRAMVGADWKRTFVPAFAGCLRKAFEQGSDRAAKILSVERLSVPRLAARTIGYRILFQVTSRGKPIRGLLDMVAMADRRTEVELFVFAALGPPAAVPAGEAAVTSIDEHLAQDIVRRAFSSLSLAA
jgi:hypothetical protein